VKEILRDARNAFARTYVDLIFTRLTDGYRRSLRAEELVYEVAELCPGLCPTRKEVESDSRFFLAEKEGVEIAQSDFLAHVLAHRTAGLYLIHSMLQPLPQSRQLLEKFRADGRLDLGTAQVERRGPPWVSESSRSDNWQTSPWEPNSGFRRPGRLSPPGDRHF